MVFLVTWPNFQTSLVRRHSLVPKSMKYNTPDLTIDRGGAVIVRGEEDQFPTRFDFVCPILLVSGEFSAPPNC